MCRTFFHVIHAAPRVTEKVVDNIENEPATVFNGVFHASQSIEHRVKRHRIVINQTPVNTENFSKFHRRFSSEIFPKFYEKLPFRL